MSELPSAIFLIADGNEFRFARFYIVCEEVPLGTPESPLIVCGLADTLRECPNVAKTRNGMPATAWKKYSNFASKNLPPSVYSGTFLFSGIPIILLIKPKNDILIAAIPFCLLYYSSSPRKISLRSTSSASSFPSALACSSGYFDPVRSISITDA